MDINQRLISALNNAKVFNKTGLGAIRIIRKRTRAGRDVRGNFFDSYSTGYLAKRQQAGYANASKVTLEFAQVNTMLEAIGFKYSMGFGGAESIIEVYITDPIKAQIAYYHNVSGAGRSRVTREFWGIETDEEIAQLNSIANDAARQTLIKEIGDILTDLNDERNKI